MAAYEVLLLNTAIPQIQAAQSGDTYVVPRDIAINATAIISANSATDALRITQTGAGNALVVEDSANPDATPFVVTAAGDVGVGTSSPQAKLQVLNQIKVSDSTQAQGALVLGDGGSTSFNVGVARWNGATNAAGAGGVGYFSQGPSNSGGHYFYTGDAQAGSTTLRMTIDTSGNLGLGVTTLSPWSSNYKALQLEYGSFGKYKSEAVFISGNAYAYADASWKYIADGRSAIYYQEGAEHRWYTAPSGTAGNAITFTQAMTLDASGNLLVGPTSASSVGNARFAVTGGATYDGQFDITANFANDTTAAGKGVLIGYNNTQNTGIISAAYGNGSESLAFWTHNNTSWGERARITSGGYFKASNNGSYYNSTGSYHEIDSNSTTESVALLYASNASYTGNGLSVIVNRTSTLGTYNFIRAFDDAAGVNKFVVRDDGNVYNTNGTYGTISDAKMKTDIVDAGSQWADIKALRFRKFKMKDDPSGLVQLGVVAQEVELTSPGLVDEHTDRDAEGNDLGTTTKSVKTSVLLMKAAVALQEAMARIETLEAEVATLKGA